MSDVIRTSNERLRFEVWAQKEGFAVPGYDLNNGRYFDEAFHWMWFAWKSRAETHAPETLPPLAHNREVRREIDGKHDVPDSQYAGILKAAESGDAVNTGDLINALWWRLGNQRKEIARLQRRKPEPAHSLSADLRDWADHESPKRRIQLVQVANELDNLQATCITLRAELADPPGDVQEAVLRKLCLWPPPAPKAVDQRAIDANALADAHRMYEAEHGHPFSESEGAYNRERHE